MKPSSVSTSMSSPVLAENQFQFDLSKAGEGRTVVAPVVGVVCRARREPLARDALLELLLDLGARRRLVQRVQLVRDVDNEGHDHNHIESECRAEERPELEASQPAALVERQGAVGGAGRDVVNEVSVVRVVATVVVLGEEVLLLATLRLVAVSVFGGIRLREG